MDIHGLYNQRMKIEYADDRGKTKHNWVHAGQLMPYEEPYPEEDFAGDKAPVNEEVERSMPLTLGEPSSRPQKRGR